MSRVLFLILLCLSLGLAACQKKVEPAVPDAAPDAALEDQLREALEKNPDLVLDVLRQHELEVYGILEQSIEANRQHEREQQIQSELEHPLQPVIDPDRPMRGPVSAPVTIVAYSDFLCPYCAKGAATVKELMAAHPGEIRFVFKHFVESDFARLLSSVFEGLGLLDQEKAWKFHDMVFESQAKFRENGQSALEEVLKSLEVDPSSLAEILTSDKIASDIKADVAEAQSFGFRGTPDFVINGVSLRGAYPISEFEAIMAATTGKDTASAEGVGNAGEQCLDCTDE